MLVTTASFTPRAASASSIAAPPGKSRVWTAILLVIEIEQRVLQLRKLRVGHPAAGQCQRALQHLARRRRRSAPAPRRRAPARGRASAKRMIDRRAEVVAACRAGCRRGRSRRCRKGSCVIAAPRWPRRSGNGNNLLAWQHHDRSTARRSPAPLAIVVLAAGKGTRMKSDLHKVLHPIAGRPMLDHLLASAARAGAERTGGGRRPRPRAAGRGAAAAAPRSRVQEPQLGTGHAVQQARAALAGFDGRRADPLWRRAFVTAATMRAMLDRLHADDAPAVVVLGFEPADPLQYGRVIAERRAHREDGRTQGRERGTSAPAACAIRA